MSIGKVPLFNLLNELLKLQDIEFSICSNNPGLLLLGQKILVAVSNKTPLV